MGRWTQYDTDSYHLPEGMERIGYDADTRCYTFRDRDGNVYQGAPGANYGTLTAVPDISDTRPNAFASDKPRPKLSVKTDGPAPKTFHDILPSNLITSPSADKRSASSSLSRSSSSSSALNSHSATPRSKFVDAVRKTALIKSFLGGFQRSSTSAQKSSTSHQVDDSENLIRHSSQVSSKKVDRAASTSSSRSSASTSSRMLESGSIRKSHRR